MNKLLLITFCITLSFIKTADPINWSKTEPYVTFDWIDDDKKSLTIVNGDTSYSDCLLYNGTHTCKGTCDEPKTKTLTCHFEGKNCRADSDNPTFKYYYTTYCDTSDDIKAKGGSVSDYTDVGVTVAISNSNFIKYSMVLLLSLLVL